jgi:transcriptional regulator with XRE-family HTH domain
MLVHHRRERKWTVESLATAIGLSTIETASLERGNYGPTLQEFFHIASALREEPAVLFIDLSLQPGGPIRRLLELWPMSDRRAQRYS